MQQQRNAVLAAIENDRRFSQQKRKLMHHRNPTTEVHLKKQPTSESLRHRSGNIDFTNLLDLRLRTPKDKLTMRPPRIRTEVAPPHPSSLRYANNAS